MLEIMSPWVNTAVSGLIGMLVVWFPNRKKQKVDLSSTEIENGSKLVTLYKDALDDLGNRYEKKYCDLEKQAKNIQLLFERKEELLEKEIELHKKQAALYKKMYDDKVREFNKYKKEHP